MPPRRAKRTTTAEREGAVETAIFDATERVLAGRSIREASVAELIAAAGVSRATFYFYFESKYAVVTELFERLLDDVLEVFRERWFDRPTVAGEDHEETLFRLHAGCYEVFSEHAPIMRAVADAYPHEDAVSAAFETMIGRITDGCAAKIAADREAGAARPGPDARELAAALVWMNERAFYVDSTPGSRDWASTEALGRTIAAVWAAAIYGPPVTGVSG
jgi:AcrR family transcriptional regulator